MNVLQGFNLPVALCHGRFWSGGNGCGVPRGGAEQWSSAVNVGVGVDGGDCRVLGGTSQQSLFPQSLPP